MVSQELEHQAIELVEAILTEIRAAKKYLHMVDQCENVEHKKMIITVAENELGHYRKLKEMYEKEKTGKFKEMNLDMPVLEILTDDLDRWANDIEQAIARKKSKIGMK